MFSSSTPHGRGASGFGDGLSCWRKHLLGGFLFAGGAGGDGLVTTPKLLPPATNFACMVFSSLLLGLLLLLLELLLWLLLWLLLL
jgi:hypothetical protein